MKQSWICPKCGRVYGPSVPECAVCNAEIPVPRIPYPNPYPNPYEPWPKPYDPWPYPWPYPDTTYWRS